MLGVLLNQNLTLDEAMSYVDRGKQQYREHQQWESELRSHVEAKWKAREAEIEAEYLEDLKRDEVFKAAGIKWPWKLSARYQRHEALMRLHEEKMSFHQMTAQLDAINMMMWLF